MRTGAGARAAATAERACRAESLRRLPRPHRNHGRLDITHDLGRACHAAEDIDHVILGWHELRHRPPFLGDDDGRPVRPDVLHDLEAPGLEFPGGNLLHGLPPGPMVTIT